MAIGLPFHEDPNSRVFGIIGQISESDNGKTYIKVNDDTLNVGWKDITAPIVVPTTTTTSGPTTTTTAGPTTTTTSGPTTTTTPIPSRQFNISPPVSGKSLWDLGTDGALTLYAGIGVASWTISSYLSTPVLINFDINGAGGGNGGDYGSYKGGQGGSGSRALSNVYLLPGQSYQIIPGEVGGNGSSDQSGGGGGGAGGIGYFSGGNGGGAGTSGIAGAGGGGGAASVAFLVASPVVLNATLIAGGGGGGGGAGGPDGGYSAIFSVSGIPFPVSDGGAGTNHPTSGGGGGGGGAVGGVGGSYGGIGNAAGFPGTNGGGFAGKSLANGNGYITLY